jgi:hypothetical protein
VDLAIHARSNPKIAEAVEGFPVHFPVRLELLREISAGCTDDDDGSDVVKDKKERDLKRVLLPLDR